jgi:hypothetical protein
MILIRTTARQTRAGAGVDYLPQLVAAIEAEGLRGTILTDGPEPRTFPGWDAVTTGKVLGSRLSGWRALHEIAASGGPALLLEDDVIPVPGGVARMLAYPMPAHLAFLSFFDIRVPHPRGEPGIRELPCDEFMQAQATWIPVATARRLEAEDPHVVHRAGFSRIHAFDLCLGLLCHELVAPLYGLVLPNLVDHQGDASVVEPCRDWHLRSGWLAS